MRPPSKTIFRDNILPFTSARNMLLWSKEAASPPISQTLPSRNQHGVELKIKKAYSWLSKSAWVIATLGRSHTVYKTHKYAPSTFNTITTRSDYVSSAAAQWERVLQDMKKEWKICRLGCALIIPLSATLLQIDAVFEDIIARAATIAAFLFSVVGLVLSVSCLLSFPYFCGGNCRSEWVKASQSFDNLESIELWSLLAFPMSSLIWSMILCVMTVLILAWNIQDGSLLSDSISGGKHARAGNIISATVLMILTMILGAFIYRWKKIGRRLLRYH